MMCMYLGDMLVGNCRMFRVALQLRPLSGAFFP